MTRFAPIAPACPDLNDSGTIRRTLLVRVKTSDGVVGRGGAFAIWPEACKAVCAENPVGFLPLLNDKLAEAIVGNRTAMRRHVVWYDETARVAEIRKLAA